MLTFYIPKFERATNLVLATRRSFNTIALWLLKKVSPRPKANFYQTLFYHFNNRVILH